MKPNPLTTLAVTFHLSLCGMPAFSQTETRMPPLPPGAESRSPGFTNSPSDELLPVQREAVPFLGTFWLFSGLVDQSGEWSRTPLPPFPFDPYNGRLPVYAFDPLGGPFLILDSHEDYEEAMMALSSPPAPTDPLRQ